MAPRDLREPLTTTPQLAWASFLDGLVGIREASRIPSQPSHSSTPFGNHAKTSAILHSSSPLRILSKPPGFGLELCKKRGA
eukprot:8462536-Pyramimonas_sp.AAC.1